MEMCTNGLEETKNNNSITFFSLTTEEKVSLQRGSIYFIFLVLRPNGGVVKETDNRLERMKARAGLHHKDLLSVRKRIPLPALRRFCSNASPRVYSPTLREPENKKAGTNDSPEYGFRAVLRRSCKQRRAWRCV